MNSLLVHLQKIFYYPSPKIRETEELSKKILSLWQNIFDIFIFLQPGYVRRRLGNQIKTKTISVPV